MSNKIYGVALTRVSTLKQDVYMGSLDQQKNRLTRFIHDLSLREGKDYQIIEWIEETTSGWISNTKNRGSLFQIEKMIETGVIKFLLIEKLDRLSRDSAFNIELVRKAAERGCDIIDVDQGGKIDFDDRSSRMIFHVKNFINEDYSYELSEKQTKKIREAYVNNGRDHQTRPVLGIDPHPDYAGIYVINPTEQLIVSDIYRKFSDTGSYEETLNYCFEKQYKTKIIHIKERIDSEGRKIPSRVSGGSPFNKEYLKTLLRSEKIRGWSEFEDTYNQFPNLQKDGVVRWYYKHGQVLDQALIDGVDFHLKSKMQKSNIERKRVYLATGILFCNDGTKFYGEPAKSGMNLYYFNSEHNLRIPMDIVDDCIKRRVKEYIQSSKTVEGVFLRAQVDTKSGLGYLRGRIKEANIFLQDVDFKIENLTNEMLRLTAEGPSRTKSIEWLTEEREKLLIKRDEQSTLLDNLKIKESYVRGQLEKQKLTGYLQNISVDFESFELSEQKSIIHKIVRSIVIDPLKPGFAEIQLRPDPNGFKSSSPSHNRGEKVRDRGEWWDKQDLNL